MSSLRVRSPFRSSRIKGDQISSIPPLPKEIIEYFLNTGLYETEGIFRVPGPNDQIRQIIKLYKKKKSVNLQQFKTHSLASALKQWFRDQSQPVMTFEFYESWIKAIELPELELRITGLQKVIKLIPERNRRLLRSLCLLLRKIHKKRDTTLMNAENLARVFSPTLLWTKEPSKDPISLLNEQQIGIQLIELLITSFHTIFHDAKLPPTFSRNVSRQQDEFLDSLELGSLLVAQKLVNKQAWKSSNADGRVVKFTESPEHWASSPKEMGRKLKFSREEEKSETSAESKEVTDLSPMNKGAERTIESPLANRRRQLLRQKISASNFADDILEEARRRVRETTSTTDQAVIPHEYEDITTLRVDKRNKELSKSAPDLNAIASIRPRSKAVCISDQGHNHNSLEDSQQVIHELLLGILSGNMLHVKQYVSLFESEDCAELQNILREMSTKK